MNDSMEVETMKNRLLLTLVGALVAGALALSGNAIAQGNGGGGGGGKGGGKAEPPDYGDLMILLRNEYGVPILDGNGCRQPIAFPDNLGCPTCGNQPCDLVPTDPTTCSVLPNYAPCAKEPDFGRMNLSRAKPDVLRSQLEDVQVNLAIADCKTLDPAGRMVYSRWVGGDLVTGTIDSPLQNLSVYKQLMLSGDIGVTLPQGAGVLETAARGMGVAVEKAGEFNLDLLVYLNRILGLTADGVEPILRKDCLPIKQEVMGEVVWVTECFLNYTQYNDWYQGGEMTDYGYHRLTNFGHRDDPDIPGLPLPAYMPEANPEPGTFEFVLNYVPTFGPIIDAVFLGDKGAPMNNIGGFVQAADDTRAVIEFMHERSVMPEDQTPVPCAPPADPKPLFDLSISDKSGFKVPKQVVASTEGREFVVTVANAGPSEAVGKIVVTATPEEGPPVLVNGLPGPFEFSFGTIDEFCEVEDGILPTLTYSIEPQIFTIGEPGDEHEATEIAWTAEVVAPTCGGEKLDTFPDNNTVYKTSNVRVTKGGGH
jgi:hypothetical protein